MSLLDASRIDEGERYIKIDELFTCSSCNNWLLPIRREMPCDQWLVFNLSSETCLLLLIFVIDWYTSDKVHWKIILCSQHAHME